MVYYTIWHFTSEVNVFNCVIYPKFFRVEGHKSCGVIWLLFLIGHLHLMCVWFVRIN
jgi:hypothetical protein